MERDAYSAAVRLAKCNFDIHLMTFYIFTKHPHLSHLVESVHYRAF